MWKDATDIDTHECRWMRFESSAIWDKVASGQQGDHLKIINGVNGARKARLHEDVLEMKVLLAQNPPKISKGALRAYLAPTVIS